MLRNTFMSTSDEIALWWMPQNTFHDKSTLVQVMHWCPQAPCLEALYDTGRRPFTFFVIVICSCYHLAIDQQLTLQYTSTRRGLKTMADILLTMFWKEFFLLNIFEFRINILWNVFLMVVQDNESGYFLDHVLTFVFLTKKYVLFWYHMWAYYKF